MTPRLRIYEPPLEEEDALDEEHEEDDLGRVDPLCLELVHGLFVYVVLLSLGTLITWGVWFCCDSSW